MTAQALGPYRAVLRLHAARRVLITGTVIRVPLWASAVVLTLHVVTHLHRSYAEAGAVAALATLGLAISAPWRGRLLDRIGLRRTVAPSLVVLTVGWSVLPFLGYWPLLAGAGLVAAFEVPTFSVVRQALMHCVGEEHRRTALSLDSVLVEISFMIGPAAGVLAATYLPTPVALQLCAYATVLGGAALWWENPPIAAPATSTAASALTSVAGAPPPTPPSPAQLDAAEVARGLPRRHARLHPAWLTPRVGAVLLVSAVATVALTSSDIGTVAALRHMGHQPWIGWELAVWGLGSAVGGIVYGALPGPIPISALITGLGASTVAVALAQGPATLAALLFVTGWFCAPTITATVDALTRLVDDSRRGEVLGWHGSALTVGSALGSPIAGAAVDHLGWPGAFAAGALAVVVGLVVAPTLRGAAAEGPQSAAIAEPVTASRTLGP